MSDTKWVKIPKATIKTDDFVVSFYQLKREWWDMYNDSPEKDYEYLEEYSATISYAPWPYFYLPDKRVWEIETKSKEDIKKVWCFLKSASLKDIKNTFGFKYGQGDVKVVENGKIRG